MANLPRSSSCFCTEPIILQVSGKYQECKFMMVLGFPWMQTHDPEISWKKWEIRAGQHTAMPRVSSPPPSMWPPSPSKPRNPGPSWNPSRLPGSWGGVHQNKGQWSPDYWQPTGGNCICSRHPKKPKQWSSTLRKHSTRGIYAPWPLQLQWGSSLQRKEGMTYGPALTIGGLNHHPNPSSPQPWGRPREGSIARGRRRILARQCQHGI